MFVEIQSAKVVQDAQSVALRCSKRATAKGNCARITRLESIARAARNSFSASSYLSCRSASYPFPRCISSESVVGAFLESLPWLEACGQTICPTDRNSANGICHRHVRQMVIYFSLPLQFLARLPQAGFAFRPLRRHFCGFPGGKLDDPRP